MIQSQTYCFVICLILTLSFCPLSQSQNSDCAINWSQTLRLSLDTVPSYNPKIVRGNSAFHVIWFGNDVGKGGGIQYTRSTNGGRTFTQQQSLVSYDSSLGIAGHLAISGNIIYLAFLTPSDTAPYYGVGLLRSTTSGETWENRRVLRSGALPTLISAQDSFVYIQCQSSFTRTLLLRSSDWGMTWEEISTNQPMLKYIASTSTLLHGIGVSGGNNREITYYRSINHAQTWVAERTLSREDAIQSTSPSLALDGLGNPLAIWNDTGAIFFRRSQDEGFFWLPAVQISEKKGAVFSDIGASEEYIAIAWDNEPASGGKIYLRGSNRFGISFCPIDSPAMNPSASEPSLVLQNNIIHLVWSEVRDSTSEIFYRQGYIPADPLSLPPSEVALYQNYPNPFNSVTYITYDIPADGLVRLTVYNILGEKIANLVNEIQKAKQKYIVRFDASDLPSGVYFYRLRTAAGVQVKKLLLLK